MHLLKRIAVALGAATVAIVGLTAQPAQAHQDVYATPGEHSTGGRLWTTDCSMYSSNVVRCTTKIWASQVVYSQGTFRNVTGWHFNNLTYLPSARAAWKTNPLGRSGEFTREGRKWKTECDTAATGRGACRSYIWSQYIARVNNRYVNNSGWVFNNMVRFAQGNVAPVTAIPATPVGWNTNPKPADIPASFTKWANAHYKVGQRTVCPQPNYVGVDMVHPDGVIRGTFSNCGGYVAYWGFRDGQWKELLGTQEIQTCGKLRSLAIPGGSGNEKCTVDGTTKAIDY